MFLKQNIWEKNPSFGWGWDKTSVPHDHRLISLGKPRDATRWSSERIFLSHPYTNVFSCLRGGVTICICRKTIALVLLCSFSKYNRIKHYNVSFNVSTASTLHIVKIYCFSGFKRLKIILSHVMYSSRPRGRGFEPHRRHCVVVLEQDTFILA